MSAIPTSVRMTVQSRDRRQCQRCGGLGREIHHRQRRRDAGHALSVCVTMCRTCHAWAHAHPEKARLYGWIVTFAQEDPSRVPLLTFHGTVLLFDEADADGDLFAYVT